MNFNYVIPKEIDINISTFWEMCLEYNEDNLSNKEYLDVVCGDLVWYVSSYIHVMIDPELNEDSLYELQDELTDYVNTL